MFFLHEQSKFDTSCAETHAMQMKNKSTKPTFILTIAAFFSHCGELDDGRLRVCVHQGARCMEGIAQQLVLPSLWKRKASVQEGSQGQREGYQWGCSSQEEGTVRLLRKICAIAWVKRSFFRDGNE